MFCVCVCVCVWNSFLVKGMWRHWILHQRLFDVMRILLKGRYVFMEFRNILFVLQVRPSHWYLRSPAFDSQNVKLQLVWAVRNAQRCTSEVTEFYGAAIHRHNGQRTSISRRSQISLNIYSSASLFLGFIERTIEFLFWEFNKSFLEIFRSPTHKETVSSHTQKTFNALRNTPLITF